MISYSSIVDEVLSAKSSSSFYQETTIHQELVHLVHHRYHNQFSGGFNHNFSAVLKQNIPKDYIQYLVVWVMAHSYDIQISPPLHVDAMWHLHLLETKSYRHLEDVIISKLKEQVNNNKDGDTVVEVVSVDHIEHSALNTQGREERLETTKRFYSTLGLDYTKYDDVQVKEEHSDAIPTEMEEGISENDDDDATRKRRRLYEDINATYTPHRLILRVRNLLGEELYFNVKKDTKMRKVYRAYAQIKGVDPNSFRFYYHGDLIKDFETPEQRLMEDNDQIDCLFLLYGC